MADCLSLNPLYRHHLIPSERSHRVPHDIADNETASLTDTLVKPEKVVAVDRESFRRLSDPVERVNQCADRIKDAIGNRLSFEYTQYCLLTNSKLVIADRTTKPDQAKGRGKVTLMSGTTKHTLCFAAAHAATQPRPIAKIGNAYYAPFEGSGPYLTWNSTDDLLKVVNEVDSDLDFRHRTAKLRTHRMGIVNAVSSGTLSPEQGIRQFTHLLYARLHCLNDAKKMGVIQLYRQAVQEMYRHITPSFFDHSLGLHFQRDRQAQALRKAMYPLRCSYIRERSERQSFLHKEVMRTFHAIKSRAQINTPYLRYVIRAQVLTSLCHEHREYLEEWWGQSTSYYAAKAMKGRAAQALCATQLPKAYLNTLAYCCKSYGAWTANIECRYRADALATVRHVRGLTQTELGKKLDYSRSTISRIETFKKYLDDDLLERAATALNIHPTNLYFDQRLP